MAKSLIVLLGVVLSATLVQARSPYASSTSSFAWDYPDQSIAGFNVVPTWWTF